MALKVRPSPGRETDELAALGAWLGKKHRTASTQTDQDGVAGADIRKRLCQQSDQRIGPYTRHNAQRRPARRDSPFVEKGRQVTLQYRQRRIKFRVVWIKPLAGSSEYQVGLEGVASSGENWGLELPEADTVDEYQNS
jgi:hypothetical protein